MAQYISAAALLLAGVACLLFARREWIRVSVFEAGVLRPPTLGERRFWAVRRKVGALVFAFFGLVCLLGSVTRTLGG